MKTNFHLGFAALALAFALVGNTALAQDSAGFLENTTTGNANSNGEIIPLSTSTDTNSVNTYSASPEYETKLSVYNDTQGKDASAGGNKPGDVITVTAAIRNLGPGDLVGYVAQVAAENLLKVSQIVDPGNGGVVRQGVSMVFPGTTQAADCNCTDKFEFKVKLNENICTDFASIASSGIVATFENKSQTIPVVCTTPAPTPTPTPTPTPVKPPKVPQTGPADTALAILAVLGGGMWMWRRKMHA